VALREADNVQLDVMMTDEIAKTAADTFKEFKAAGGNTGNVEVTTCKIASERVSPGSNTSFLPILKWSDISDPWSESSVRFWSLNAASLEAR